MAALFPRGPPLRLDRCETSTVPILKIHERKREGKTPMNDEPNETHAVGPVPDHPVAHTGVDAESATYSREQYLARLQQRRDKLEKLSAELAAERSRLLDPHLWTSLGWTEEEHRRWEGLDHPYEERIRQDEVSSTVKDTGRQKVYEAGHRYERLVAEALDSPTGEVVVDGVSYRPEPAPMLSSRRDVQDYCNEQLRTLQRDQRDYDGMERILVKVMVPTRYSTAAYSGVWRAILLPSLGRNWTSTATLQHELAHHLCRNMPYETERAHGTRFRSTFVRLLRETGTPERSRLLRACYLAVDRDVDDAFIERR